MGGIAGFGLQLEGEAGGGVGREGGRGEEAGEVHEAFNGASRKIQAVNSSSCGSKRRDFL